MVDQINLILTSENMIKGEPIMCGNVDMLCLPYERIVCIADINIKNGYIFIENKNYFYTWQAVLGDLDSFKQVKNDELGEGVMITADKIKIKVNN